MRTTKKDVYAEFGIQFDGKLIFCDPLGIWINPLLPIGTNNKVGKAATWSMLHGNETVNIIDMHIKMQKIMELANITEITLSCPIHCDGCYCDNGCFNFPDNKAKNLLKLILARFFREWLERALKAQIKADKMTQVRIHVSGDFFDIDYVYMWKRITQYFLKTVIFWTYTKVQFALDILSGLKNVFIVPSKTPFGFNFGTCSELLYRYRKLTELGYRVHICACGTEFEKHCADCKHGCKAIGNECDYVLFIKHSTKDYTAGEHDIEEYNAICDIIRNQQN